MSGPSEGDGLTSAALRRLLADARGGQRLPKLSVSADSIFEAYQARRGIRRARITSVLLGVGACISLVYFGVSVDRAVESRRGGPLVAAYSDVAVRTVERATTTTTTAKNKKNKTSATAKKNNNNNNNNTANRGDDLRLAGATTIEPLGPLGPEARAPMVLGPRLLALSDGSYRIRVDAEEPALLVETAGGAIELRAGVAIVTVAADRVDVVVEQGEAYWVRGEDRTPIHGAEASGDVRDPEPEAPSAAQLAARAEESLHRGRRSVALRHLRQLVAKHPRSTEAGPALLDLGGLLRAEGDADSARCAYQLYLDRYPSGALISEVKRARDRLGAGPQCRGLRPRR